MSIIDDNTILELLQEHHFDGYRALFDKYYKSLCLQATFLVNNSDDAQDIVQNVFVYLWKNNKFSNIETSLSAYLGRSVRNECLLYLKKQQKEKDMLDDYASLESVVSTEDPEQMQQVYTRMNAAIEALPQQCREIFRMVHLEKRKYKEAADLANVSVNTVKTQVRIAMGRLREALTINNDGV
ncbi:MAG: RNA polymerase sigma-70 factor [Filimonas sp.]|nr:RNA polymerase sigma-70 factor [Filimonas sp.]